MSLTYNSEHLAWQQRVGQEKSRASTFYKTAGSFYSHRTAFCRSPFPNANQDSVSHNYKTLSYNLAYTFGGTKPIRNATFYSTESSADKLRNQVKHSRNEAKNDKKSKNSKKLDKHSMHLYINDLKQSINDEKLRRTQLEKKLKLIR